MNMRQIYKKIAKKHGVTPADVKRDMQAAINHAYSNTPNDGITKAYQKQIPGRVKSQQQKKSSVLLRRKSVVKISST